ncbi:hypothetical protein NM208_g5123 [Fusarium decemcellulare]|uniref:Uncharacterized protein n=1 Tax=Fusarium decemcellulare TaxID=57161 RepID=A0ACC1SI47_9HYPO|nr:hypothetical protein NM208_g5123 [Fusarium decemcellulare]
MQANHSETSQRHSQLVLASELTRTPSLVGALSQHVMRGVGKPGRVIAHFMRSNSEKREEEREEKRLRRSRERADADMRRKFMAGEWTNKDYTKNPPASFPTTLLRQPLSYDPPSEVLTTAPPLQTVQVRVDQLGRRGEALRSHPVHNRQAWYEQDLTSDEDIDGASRHGNQPECESMLPHPPNNSTLPFRHSVETPYEHDVEFETDIFVAAGPCKCCADADKEIAQLEAQVSELIQERDQLRTAALDAQHQVNRANQMASNALSHVQRSEHSMPNPDVDASPVGAIEACTSTMLAQRLRLEWYMMMYPNLKDEFDAAHNGGILN